MLDKHLTPNLVAAALVLLSFSLPSPWSELLLSTGLFALSGALTNWLAVHMLFERVPGLYGSGVITLHFDEFKAGILRMVHEELLSKDKVERLLAGAPRHTQSAHTDQDLGTPSASSDSATTTPAVHATVGQSSANNIDAGNGDDRSSTTGRVDADAKEAIFDLEPLLTAIDLDLAYDQLVATIINSSFGSMLAMLGGAEALQPLRDPFKQRMRGFLTDAAHSPRIQALVSEQLSRAASSERFVQRLDQLLRARLDEMTPEMVRDIMQRMIRHHLGWLVIWGGVFGGLIGLLAGLAGLLA